MPPLLAPPALAGDLVVLEPLHTAHVDGLVDAASEDRTTYRYMGVPMPEAVADYVGTWIDAQDRGETIAFAQVARATGRAVGVTRYLTFRTRPGQSGPYGVEIGGTWLAPSVQRTGVNVEAKLLLLAHAFEEWRVERVDLKTDSRNERSRNAIAALGATFEGVLRRWQPSQVDGEDALLRDSAIYSILEPEWPDVRQRLLARLDR